jgi:hypothetical protein
MSILGCDSKDDVHITSCEEAAGNVSTMVWINSNIRFVHSFHPSLAAHSQLRDVFHPMHSLAAWAAFSASPFYHLRSSSPSTPNRSFISGAFTSTGDSSVSTTTSISDDSFRDYKQTDGGPIASTPNSQKSKSRGYDIGVMVGGIGGEIGKVQCETSESKAGVPSLSESPNGPQITSSDCFQRSQLSLPYTQLRQAPTQNRPQQAVHEGRFKSLTFAFRWLTSNPQRNWKWTLPADLQIIFTPTRTSSWAHHCSSQPPATPSLHQSSYTQQRHHLPQKITFFAGPDFHSRISWYTHARSNVRVSEDPSLLGALVRWNIAIVSPRRSAMAVLRFEV